jgi:WhiB family redox-sensing transcriptional regulator
MTQAFIALNKVETLTDLVGDHPAAWRMMGACNNTDPDLAFKGDQNSEYEGDPYARDTQKATCISCPVAQECLDHALVVDERFGIWGGMTTRERDGYRPVWERDKGKQGVRAAKSRYAGGVLDPWVKERYERRLARARACLSSVGLDVEQVQVLRLLVENPETPCGVLASRMGWKRDWLESRFNAICKEFGVV